jgi:hypothetical protein
MPKSTAHWSKKLRRENKNLTLELAQSNESLKFVKVQLAILEQVIIFFDRNFISIHFEFYMCSVNRKCRQLYKKNLMIQKILT